MGVIFDADECWRRTHFIEFGGCSCQMGAVSVGAKRAEDVKCALFGL
jgi:hypothetical protein